MGDGAVFRRIIARCIVDPCVRTGRVPRDGVLAREFGRLSRGRIIRVRESHPLSSILGRDEWKTSYSISDHTLLWMWAYLQRRRPKAILELGSGMSTLVFLKYVELFGGSNAPRIVSVDHDEEWLALTRQRAEALHLPTDNQSVRFCLTTLGDVGLCGLYTGAAGYVLDLTGIAAFLGSPELVLIDGPPSTVGRRATLPSLRPVLTKPATIFLDDAFRVGESGWMEEWTQHFHGLRHLGTYPLGNGLGCMKYEPMMEN